MCIRFLPWFSCFYVVFSNVALSDGIIWIAHSVVNGQVVPSKSLSYPDVLTFELFSGDGNKWI